MAALEIVQPQNGATFTGGAPISFEGKVTDPPGTLYYSWYLPSGTVTGLKVSASMPVGSHVITLTAKDVPDDTLANLQKLKTILTAGGPLVKGIEKPCVIHVFNAKMVWSGDKPYKLSKANCRLQALAPLRWGKLTGEKQANAENNEYETDKDYASINRIQYRWRF